MLRGNKNAMNYRAAISWTLVISLFFFNLQYVYALSMNNDKVTYSDISVHMRKIRYRTDQLKMIKPEQDNQSKTYEYASDAVKATEEVELFYLDHPDYKSAQNNLVGLARFWRQIDRVIGDVDHNADEVYITYLMLYPKGRYHFEASNWVNKNI